MDCFNHTIGRDNKREFLSEMIELVKQKIELGLIDKKTFIDKNKNPEFIFAFSDKKGEDKFNDFVEACRAYKYNGKIIYLDKTHKLKDK